MAEARDSQSPALHLPDDRPLDETRRRQYGDYRLDPVIDSLEARLADWLRTPRHDRRQTPPRIGLFGTLGQGKSTVVGNVVTRLARRRNVWQRFRDWILGPRIVHFDVSFFKADLLEWRFYTAVLWRRILRNLVLVTLFALILVSIVFIVHVSWKGWTLTTCWSDPAGCWGWVSAEASLKWALIMGAVALLVPFLKYVPFLKSILGGVTATYNTIDPTQGLYTVPLDRFIRNIAVFVCALPEIVIIDDLDRAAVEQQRGFLRALSRFSQGLGFALVVCMDETELLAAPPNPEAPAELLRKTITVELRLPERTREDIALLAAVCAREFAQANYKKHQDLADSLRSVQFVTDLMRILWLTAVDGPVQPRKVWRLLTGVAQCASQLRVNSVDDLSALLRIEGLYQLAPTLRHAPDMLRKALEAGRFDDLAALLAQQGLKPERGLAIRSFFERTRLMQPGIRDGWFRLLGGFSTLKIAEITAPDRIWRADWPMASRSLDFFRLFVEAVELDAQGYPHDLVLEIFTPDTVGDDRVSQFGFRFAVPGGYIEEFSNTDLPEAFRIVDNEYLAQCWLLRICALVTTEHPARRYAMHLRAHRWVSGFPTSLKRALLDLFWRECLADSDVWVFLQEQQRQGLWDLLRADLQTNLALLESLVFHRYLFGKLLDRKEFAEAWYLLSLPIGQQLLRDGRTTLFWWQMVTPEIVPTRLPQTSGSGNTSLPSQVWPAPMPGTFDTTGWKTTLKAHFTALKALHTAYRDIPTPTPLRHAWRMSQVAIGIEDSLELIFDLAYDSAQPLGERWSVELPRPWVEDIHGTLAEALQALVKGDGVVGGDAINPQLPLFPTLALLPLSPKQASALVLVAVLREWQPGSAERLIATAWTGALHELCRTLSDRGELPDWLKSVLADGQGEIESGV